jgi:hypothetical protein
MELIQLSAIGTSVLLLLEFCEICRTILRGDTEMRLSDAYREGSHILF